MALLTNFAGVLLKIAILAVFWRIGTTFKDKENKREMDQLKEFAKKRKKPLLNVGCGRVDGGGVNIDIIRRDLPNFKIVDVNRKLPFKDKQFSGVFASNIIEHLSSPEFSLKEFRRVGERVYIGYPRWWQPGTWLTPDHKWLVFGKQGKDYRFVPYNPLYAYIPLALIFLWT